MVSYSHGKILAKTSTFTTAQVAFRPKRDRPLGNQEYRVDVT